MVTHMKTTVDIADDLLLRAKKEAAASRTTLRSLIERHMDVAVLEANSGQAAIDITLSHPDIDLIILDLAMPIMSGWDFLKEIRRDPRTASIPVVVITAHGQSGTAQEVAELGADGYLEKPFRRHRGNFVRAPMASSQHLVGCV